MTGRLCADGLAGFHTFKYKQSSLGVPTSGAASLTNGNCMQSGPYSLAERTPCHAVAGCGARQRKSPTGGAANGMPLNAMTPSCTLPRTTPVSRLASMPGDAAMASALQKPAASITASSLPANTTPASLNRFFMKSPCCDLYLEISAKTQAGGAWRGHRCGCREAGKGRSIVSQDRFVFDVPDIRLHGPFEAGRRVAQIDIALVKCALSKLDRITYVAQHIRRRVIRSDVTAQRAAVVQVPLVRVAKAERRLGRSVQAAARPVRRRGRHIGIVVRIQIGRGEIDFPRAAECVFTLQLDTGDAGLCRIPGLARHGAGHRIDHRRAQLQVLVVIREDIRIEL